MQQRSPATWTLTDGNAGNVRQAEALARALGLDARAWALEARAPWAWWAPRRFPGDAAAFGPEFQHAMAEPPELAIGCGRRAALATRLLGARGARTVQILAPRIAPRHWDLVVAPEHDGLDGANVIRTLGSLKPVDDAWLAAARREFAALGEFPGPRTALLLGGHSRHSNFDSALLGQAAAHLGDHAVARRARALVQPRQLGEHARRIAVPRRWLARRQPDLALRARHAGERVAQQQHRGAQCECSSRARETRTTVVAELGNERRRSPGHWYLSRGETRKG